MAGDIAVIEVTKQQMLEIISASNRAGYRGNEETDAKCVVCTHVGMKKRTVSLDVTAGNTVRAKQLRLQYTYYVCPACGSGKEDKV